MLLAPGRCGARSARASLTAAAGVTSPARPWRDGARTGDPAARGPRRRRSGASSVEWVGARSRGAQRAPSASRLRSLGARLAGRSDPKVWGVSKVVRGAEARPVDASTDSPIDKSIGSTSSPGARAAPVVARSRAARRPLLPCPALPSAGCCACGSGRRVAPQVAVTLELASRLFVGRFKRCAGARGTKVCLGVLTPKFLEN